jgi:1-acyl-sn-glycerol-3-phosphate acyltransferase
MARGGRLHSANFTMMKVLNILQALFLAFWSVLWISLALLVTLVTGNGERALAMARRFWAPALIWAARVKLEVEPFPQLDWEKPHIFVLNHESMLDIACAFAALPVNLRFVAKHSLAKVPFLGWYMRMTGMIFVNRSDRSQAVASLKRAGERIRAGANILAFPEGTRSKDGRILPFKKGPFVVAVEAGVPIIPVAISGSGRALPSGGFNLVGGVVRMKVGQPISTADRGREGRDGLLIEVREAILGLHREIGGLGSDLEAIAEVGKEGSAAPIRQAV